MSLIPINIKLGVAKDDEDYTLSGAASNSQWVRFSGKNVQSQGGWQLRVPSQAPMSGIARGMHQFATSDGSLYAAIGTHRRLYINSAAYIQNVTPSRATGTLGNNPFSTISTSDVVTVAHTAHGLKNGDWSYLGNSATFNGLTIGGSSGNLPSNPFTTSNGSPVVQITHVNHGMATNDELNLTGSTTINGVTLAGIYLIRVLSAEVYQIYASANATSSGSGGGTPSYNYRRAYEITFVDINTYTIVDVATASGTGTGGGNAVQYLYEINSGLQNGVSGTGYSSGGWSVGPYSVSFAGSTITFNPLTWSFGMYGDILLACPAGNTIFQWQQNWSTRATPVPNAPAKVLYVIVTSQRQVIALGCTTTLGNFDPMQMRWSDIEDITDWTPSQSNNSGNLKLSLGSQIICGSSGDSGSLVWTDKGFYFINYTGVQGTSYQESLIAPNFGICGPNAFVDNGIDVFWVTPRGSFARYRGGVPEELPCRSKKWFIENQPLGQMFKIYAFYDQRYPAISFLFPFVQGGSTDPGECNMYIRSDITLENGDGVTGWSVGSLDRTAWDDSTIFPFPLAVDAEGYLYEQENGQSANGNALTRSIEFRQTAMWADSVGIGDRVVNVNKVVPVANVISGSLGVFFDFRRWPKGPVVTKPTTGIPFAVTNATEYLSIRGQGRSMAIRLISNSTNDEWTVGAEWSADLSAGSRR